MTSYYTGHRRENGDAFVYVDGKPLPTRNDLRNHSPDGLEWGYAGSGPAQCALAILAHHLGDDVAAVELHQLYHHEVVARAPRPQWTTNSAEIAAWIAKRRAA